MTRLQPAAAMRLQASASRSRLRAPRQRSSLGREERPDVVHAGGAEQRVAQRVTDDVGVGVPLEPVRVRDLDAAEHERTARDQAVRVEGGADAELSQAGPRAARAR